MKYDIPESDWSDTVRKRMAYANRRGIPTGPVPLGYLKVRKHGQTFVEADPETAPLVREAFRLTETGELSVRDIVTVIDAAGLVSRRGVPLSAMALWRVLTNLFYCGPSAMRVKNRRAFTRPSSRGPNLRGCRNAWRAAGPKGESDERGSL